MNKLLTYTLIHSSMPMTSFFNDPLEVRGEGRGGVKQFITAYLLRTFVDRCPLLQFILELSVNKTKKSFFKVCILGDSVGSILAYDALCRNVKRSASDGSVADADISPGKVLCKKISR